MRRFVLLSFLLFFGVFGSASSAVAEEHLIAVVIANSLPLYHDIHESFVRNLKKVYGANYRIYVQTPNADTMSLRNSVRKAVVIGADLIVTYGANATLAAKQETNKVPVLYAGVYNPVEHITGSGQTLVGSGVGGVRGDGPVQTLLKFFTDAIETKELAIVYERNNPEGILQYKALTEIGMKRGFNVIAAVVDKPKNLPQVLMALPVDLDGVFLANSENPQSIHKQVIDYAELHQLPVISQTPTMAEQGAFMALEADPIEQGEKLAVLVDQILADENFNKFPLITPRQVSFVVNMNVAHQLNITIPLQTLAVTSRIVR